MTLNIEFHYVLTYFLTRFDTYWHVLTRFDTFLTRFWHVSDTIACFLTRFWHGQGFWHDVFFFWHVLTLCLFCRRGMQGQCLGIQNSVKNNVTRLPGYAQFTTRLLARSPTCRQRCFDTFLTRFRFCRRGMRSCASTVSKKLFDAFFLTRHNVVFLTRFDTFYPPLQPNANSVKKKFDTQARTNIFWHALFFDTFWHTRISAPLQQNAQCQKIVSKSMRCHCFLTSFDTICVLPQRCARSVAGGPK